MGTFCASEDLINALAYIATDCCVLNYAFILQHDL